MKKLKKGYLKFALAMSLFACTNYVHACDQMPKVTVHHQQVNSDEVNVSLGIEDLGDDVVALEISLVADDIKEVLNLDAKVADSYVTYKLMSAEDGKEKLICYIVSEDRNVPLKVTDGKLALVDLGLKTSGKIELDKTQVTMKLVEVGYAAHTHDGLDMVYTEGAYTPDTNTDNDTESDDNTNNDAGSDNDTDNNLGNGSDSDTDNDSDNDSDDDDDSDDDSNDDSDSDSNKEDNNVANKPDQEVSGEQEDTQTHVSFADIESHWAKDAIMQMASKGIIKGYEDGSFRPSASITRGEFATLLARAFEIEKVGEANPFTDVVADKWYTDGIVSLYHAGITSGRPDGSFGVNAPITNEEICTMLNRTISVLQLDIKEQGIAINFTDSNQISSYAKEAVEALTKMGIISGKPDGSFGPKASTSRAQVAVMLDRLFTLKSE